MLDRATVRRGHVTSATSRATVHNATFPACQTPGFIGETEGSSVEYEFARVFTRVHNRELSKFLSEFSVGSDK
jgi:hypothetical protein